MPDIIDDLFYGNLDITFLESKKGTEYNKLCSRVETLLEKLSEQGCDQLADRLGDAIDELDIITRRTYFSIGFRWGARMAIAILTENPNIFEMEK